MKHNPVMAQTVRSLTIRDQVLCISAMCASTSFPYVGLQEEEQHLQALIHELSESGFSPSEIASYVRDVTGRIYSSVLQMPVDQRGLSWFCKETLHRLCSDIQIHCNPRLPGYSHNTAGE